MTETTYKTTAECPCCHQRAEVEVTVRGKVRRERAAYVGGGLAPMVRDEVGVEDMEIVSVETATDSWDEVVYMTGADWEQQAREALEGE